MHVTFPLSPFASLSVAPDAPDVEPPDIWFDAVDHIDMDKQWFDIGSHANDEENWYDADADFSLGDRNAANHAEQCIPFTEDCRRCVKELIRQVAEAKENELLFAGLSSILPGLPADILLAAHHLYVAVTERKNIDLAMLSSMGLASSYLLDNGNMISRMALFIRETLLDYVGDSYLGQFLGQDGEQASRHFFTGLAVLAIVARHWITDDGAPQRRLLRVPAYLGNLLLRSSSYWNHLGRMAQHAAQVCRLAMRNTDGNHRYLCIEQMNGAATATLNIAAQKSWICTRMENAVEMHGAERICPFTGYLVGAHHQVSRGEIEGVSRQTNSAAADQQHGAASQALLVASAATVTVSARHPGMSARTVRGAALAFAGTALLIAGKFIRDVFFVGRDDADGVQSDSQRQPKPEPHQAPATMSANCDIAADLQRDDVPASIPTSASPKLLCRNRLIGYLHSIRLFSSNEASDKELAQAALRLIRQAPRHQTDLAHIALYGTGLFGERHDEYLDSTAEALLVGDLLSKLLFDHRSLEAYLLEEFFANRRISIAEFHKKITGWSFEKEDAELVQFFNERFLFPLMPVLNVHLKTDDPADEYHLVLVGSATWFFLYIGTKFVWANVGRREEKENPEEMVLFGAYIFRMLMNEQLVEGSNQVIAFGIKLAGLFLHSAWSPASLPDLREVQAMVADSLTRRIKSDSEIVRAFDAAKVELDRTAREPWHSRGTMAEKLLLRHCGDVNAKLYVASANSSSQEKRAQKKLKRITGMRADSVYTLKSLQEHAYCYSRSGNIIKIPTVNYRYKSAISEFVTALKKADNALLRKLFSIGDVFSPEFSYDDYQFINKAALTEIQVVVSRARDVRELLAFGSVVQTWKPRVGYFFFNATWNGETHTYITNRTANDYWIKKLDTSDLLKELFPYFEAWPPATLKKIGVVISTDHDSVKTVGTEPISTFIERLVEKRYRDAEKLLYESGYETPILDVMAEFLKDVFVPFYSCITSLQMKDATNAVVSCVLDGSFTLGPLMKGGVAILKQTAKTVSKRVLIKIVQSPSFIASPDVIFKKTINIRSVISSVDIYSNEETLSLGKSALYLIVDALDPGISLIINANKMVAEFGKLFVSGNMIAIVAHISRNWRSVAEASVRVKSLTDSRKILVRVSKINNRGEDFEPDINRTATPISLNYKKNTSFLSLVQYDAGYYNIFRLAKSENAILAGETGEVADRGDKVYVMLNARSPTGIFFKYACSLPVSNICKLSPWLPPVTNASIIRLSGIIEKERETNWVFEDTKHLPQPFLYPDHQCEIFEDGYSPSKVYEIIEIGAVYYIFDPQEPYLRPLRVGDKSVIVPRRHRDFTLSLKRNHAGNIVITLVNKPSGPSEYSSYSLLFLARKYATRNAVCSESSAIVPNAADDSLIVNIENNCFLLKLSAIRNQFFIVSNHLVQPSFKVGWSSSDNRWIPVAPHTGESSVHAGISLEHFINEQHARCDGIAINRVPTALVSGAVMHEGNTWLKVAGHYYRLGPWREGICPLYCSNTSRVAAWLRYDLFTESFDVVHDSDDWAAAKKKQTESAFKKLDKLTVQGIGWYDIAKWINLSQQSDNSISPLMLRLYQTTFLQGLRCTDRMELLSLPTAFLLSWSLHPDALAYIRDYPALALGLSLQRQRMPSTAGVQSTQIPLLHRMYLNNHFINTHYSPGKVIVGGSGEHAAIWLEDRQSANAVGILLKRHELNFYGEHITISDGMMKWIPDGNCVPARAVVQFMQESNVQPELLTDIYKKNMWVSHAERGLAQLRREGLESRIDYAVLSPDGNWVALIDSEKTLSLFSLQGLFASHGNATRIGVIATHRQRLPVDLKPQEFALCMVSDAGEFYYPGKFTWHRVQDRHALWSSPPGFVPILVTPDQRFLGFQHPQRCGTLMYDQHEKRLIFLRRPAAPSWKSVSAVAFSPLNALLALAFEDGNVYIYDLIEETVESTLDPVANVELRSLVYANSTASYRYKQAIVMRFEGVFRYLTLIYDMGVFGPLNDMNDRKIVYDIYGFAPPISKEKDDISLSREEKPGE